MRQNLIIILIFTLLSNILHAQFDLSAEWRPRFELNNGQAMVPTDSSQATAYVSQRSRINLSYTTDAYRFYLSVQDVRNWGDDNIAAGTGAFARTGSSGIHQAWLQLNLNSTDILKIGRQEFSYDDQRLLSGRNWNQYGQTYDALLLKLQKSSWFIDIAVSYNNDSDKGNPAGFGLNNFAVDPITRRLRTLNFIYLKKEISQAWYISATALLTGYQKDKISSITYFMGTYGLYSKIRSNGFEAQANLFGQSGKTQQGKQQHAFMTTVEASYRHAGIKAGLGLDILSGHDAANTDPDYQADDHAFDLFYGLRFLRYGLMNQYNIPAHTLNGGLVDLYPQIVFYPHGRHTITIDYHFFSLHQAVANPTDPNTILKGSLGSELDIVWQYAISKELNLHTGFTYYFTNNTFAKVKHIDPAHIGQPYFGWIMLTFKPFIFSSAR
ncbi:MAG: alginate export family protein [Bacteroidales bacterium]|nr:alginate export family protein [Bacteroidales bacterium]